jgi:hypothetical protein
MCPACLASTALLVGGVFSAGGLTTLFAKIVVTHKAANSERALSMNNLSEPQNQNKEKR